MPIGHTLTLDLNEWDLTLDSGGNIATSVGPYAIAQNVANAVRLFTNDAWYDPERGIPHFIVDLGFLPQESVVRSRIGQAARGVEGVAAARVENLGLEDRVLTGNIRLTTTEGDTSDVAL